MSSMLHFNNEGTVIAQVPGLASIEELAKETGVYSATPEFVARNCGPLANSFLSAIPTEYYSEARSLGLWVNIDVRVHRLYPGDFPAYPGWHCDGEARETYFAQPDLFKVKCSRHLIGTVSSHPEGVSNTQFAGQKISLEGLDGKIPEQTLWGWVDAQVRKIHPLCVWDSADGELIQFDNWTLHRCMAAKTRGWRLFFRCSMWNKPHLNGGGCISRQEHVYKLAEGTGW